MSDFMYDFMNDTHTQKILNLRGWQYELTDNDTAILLHWLSPAGQDFAFEVDRDNAISGIIACAENFDIDEQVSFWIDSRGKNGVPTSVKKLLENTETIKEELENLAGEL